MGFSNRIVLTAGMGIVLAVSQPAPAQSTAARRCVSIPEPAARLACYDAVFATPPSSSDEDAQADVSKPASAPRDEFGFTSAQAQASSQRSRPAEPNNISAVITAVRRRPTGEFIVTLANGQTWVQRELDERARIVAGNTVTIRKAALGSYLLITPDRIATRVRRLQ